VVISRRNFLASTLAAPLSVHAQTRRPNIVIILADDLGYGELGCQGMSADIDEMDQVVGQFLEFARGEDEARLPGELPGLLAEIGDHYAKLGKRISVRALPMPELAFARQSLRRALTNLIDNALRYAGEPLEVEARGAGGGVEIDVLDRGPGIPEGEAERLKRPFTRLEPSRSGRGGSGLGLAIVERVARAHGGRLELLPRPGGGLIARVVLAPGEGP